MALRDTAGTIRHVRDLERVAAVLAKHFDLPHRGKVQVGYVPWKGQHTRAIPLFTAPDGYFTVARWAARGRYRWRIEDIEGQLVEAVGFWLYSHRNRTLPKGQRPGWSDDGLADEVLAAWYGPEVAARIIAGRRQDWGNEKRVLLGVGVLLAAVMALSWLFGR